MGVATTNILRGFHKSVRILFGTKQSGFTFVEVMVVSVIVAILAAVAIPIYSGYVENQRIEVVKNMAQTAAMSANIFYRRTGDKPTLVSELKFFNPDPTRFTVEIIDEGVTVTDVTVPNAHYHVNF